MRYTKDAAWQEFLDALRTVTDGEYASSMFHLFFKWNYQLDMPMSSTELVEWLNTVWVDLTTGEPDLNTFYNRLYYLYPSSFDHEPQFQNHWSEGSYDIMIHANIFDAKTLEYLRSTAKNKDEKYFAFVLFPILDEMSNYKHLDQSFKYRDLPLIELAESILVDRRANYQQMFDVCFLKKPEGIKRDYNTYYSYQIALFIYLNIRTLGFDSSKSRKLSLIIFKEFLAYRKDSKGPKLYTKYETTLKYKNEIKPSLDNEILSKIRKLLDDIKSNTTITKPLKQSTRETFFRSGSNGGVFSLIKTPHGIDTDQLHSKLGKESFNGLSNIAFEGFDLVHSEFIKDPISFIK